ncbi:uncharacterized protein H6S33_006107 [Morchella sextelata]|uniref:uncharacterized protein n=1 Tax=Morchella sextelata TaxID=1174677 RepID=UPI001D05447D|nr:uncharacterized protein H6S33_006107 [Morchella sextelata]KAH0614221.1 hypothetical protein H6S33_006107 [Morchella sextelata]
MNNAQFRKLLETPRSERPNNGGTSATPSLGSRQRSSMPMTPRSVATQSDFAKQVAAHNAALNPKPARKFRSSAAPLGTALPEGYVDRSKTRDDGADDERLEALAELAKEGKIDRDEYVRQTKLLGGDVKSTHLVKGLDFALLEKIRRGEDVMNKDQENDVGMEEEEEEDVEDKLEKALESEVVVAEKEKKEKKGVKAAPVPKTRAEILAALKESRRAAKEAAQPALGAKFRKIGEVKPKEKQKPVEPEREKVKYVTLPDGRVKKMVKRDKGKKAALEAPDPTSAPLGMMPPPPRPGVQIKEDEEDEDIDIFEGAGTEYNPLAGLQDSDSDSDSDDSDREPGSSKKLKPDNDENIPPPPPTSMPPPPRPKLNYFGDEPSSSSSSREQKYQPPTASSLLSDPALAAALAKASSLNPISSSSTTSREDAEKAKRHAALLESADRDAFDIDFGFGGSRDFGDEDEDDGYQEKKKGSGSKRKRGGGAKVKKGDKNDAGVVGKLVEERYGKGKGKA